MATVRKRSWKSKEGTKTAWIADYFDQTGSRRLRTFDSEREAKNFLVDALHEVKRGVHTPESISITVAEAGDLWLVQAETDGLEASTLRQYRQHLDLHIKPFIGGDIILDKL